MTYEEAVVLQNEARTNPALRATPEQRERLSNAMSLVHEHRMATDPTYKRDADRFYQKLCIGIGRIDLLKNVTGAQ